jgi:hypothetical protein
MLRDDTSPVKDRIKQLKDLSFPSNIAFSACNVAKQGMEKREGHPITIIPQASLVPSGVVRLMELQEISGQRVNVPENARLAITRVVSVEKSIAGGLMPGIPIPQHDMVGCTNSATLRRLSSSNTGANDGSPRLRF